MTANGAYPAIQGNGMYAGNLSVTKWNGYTLEPQISAPNSDMAIYWPQNGSLNIEQGVFTGKTAVWAKSGNITVSGGEPLWQMAFVTALFEAAHEEGIHTCLDTSGALYRENRRFLMLLDRIRDRSHRYYSCPRCRQPVRVPRGKGKISITCPKCSEKFIKKT